MADDNNTGLAGLIPAGIGAAYITHKYGDRVAKGARNRTNMFFPISDSQAQTAEHMRQHGVSANDIWQKHGVFRGADGKWRTENMGNEAAKIDWTKAPFAVDAKANGYGFGDASGRGEYDHAGRLSDVVTNRPEWTSNTFNPDVTFA